MVVSLDVIKTDVLLHSLMQFGDPIFRHFNLYPVELQEELVRFSRRKIQRGELKALANRFDKSRESLAVQIRKIRRGHIPVYWTVEHV